MLQTKPSRQSREKSYQFHTENILIEFYQLDFNLILKNIKELIEFYS